MRLEPEGRSETALDLFPENSSSPKSSGQPGTLHSWAGTEDVATDSSYAFKLYVELDEVKGGPVKMPKCVRLRSTIDEEKDHGQGGTYWAKKRKEMKVKKCLGLRLSASMKASFTSVISSYDISQFFLHYAAFSIDPMSKVFV